MAIFFTADTHFGHGSLRGLLGRPFPDTRAMDEGLVEAWNETVGPGDEVWHLGDFAVGHRDPAAVLARLNGTKRLVAGNNDPPAIRALAGWAEVCEFREIEAEGQALVLCHYPLRSWRRGALNLHGHSHGRLKPLPRQYDVGVDARGYRPVRVSELRLVRAVAA
ncbi:metallophosphoesterase family protein [Roseomonas sp. CCTCC AB2023176]|uniref:metallophosphoesterase family protein n=1 Tax=Roseomonas sp. CCTCC AB2023176 TaxID=3342640 RepID=UPI0035D8FEBB